MFVDFINWIGNNKKNVPEKLMKANTYFIANFLVDLFLYDNEFVIYFNDNLNRINTLYINNIELLKDIKTFLRRKN